MSLAPRCIPQPNQVLLAAPVDVSGRGRLRGLLAGALATTRLDAGLPLVDPFLEALDKRYDHEEGVGVLAQLGLRYGIVFVHWQRIDSEPLAALNLIAGAGREQRVQRYVPHNIEPSILVVDECLDVVVGVNDVRDVEAGLLINLKENYNY